MSLCARFLPELLEFTGYQTMVGTAGVEEGLIRGGGSTGEGDKFINNNSAT